MLAVDVLVDGYKIADAAGTTFDEGHDRVISRIDGGRLIGGVLYTSYTGASVWMHAAGFFPHWLNREWLYYYFHYPFVQLSCHKVFCSAKGSNPNGLRFVRKVGFRQIVRIPEVYPGHSPEADMVVFEMLRKECRWLEKKPREISDGAV